VKKTREKLKGRIDGADVRCRDAGQFHNANAIAARHLLKTSTIAVAAQSSADTVQTNARGSWKKLLASTRLQARTSSILFQRHRPAKQAKQW
jgi:predicted secreted protein